MTSKGSDERARLSYRSIHYKAAGMIVSVSLTRLVIAVVKDALSINICVRNESKSKKGSIC